MQLQMLSTLYYPMSNANPQNAKPHSPSNIGVALMLHHGEVFIFRAYSLFGSAAKEMYCCVSRCPSACQVNALIVRPAPKSNQQPKAWTNGTLLSDPPLMPS